MKEILKINNTCVSCDLCLQVCPEDAIISTGVIYSLDDISCTLCGLCIPLCPVDAIKVQSTSNK